MIILTAHFSVRNQSTYYLFHDDRLIITRPIPPIGQIFPLCQLVKFSFIQLGLMNCAELPFNCL